MRTPEEIEYEIEETKAELENVHGTETEVYSRIVGYYRAVRNWNKGKRDEFEHRTMFSIEDSENHGQKKCAEPKTSEKNKANEKKDFSAGKENQKEKTEFSGVLQKKTGYYEIYTRKTCPNCPPVKNFMNRTKLSGKSVDVDSATGLAEAAEKGVFAAPTVIFYDKNGNETARGHNIEELEEIFSKIPMEA